MVKQKLLDTARDAIKRKHPSYRQSRFIYTGICGALLAIVTDVSDVRKILHHNP